MTCFVRVGVAIGHFSNYPSRIFHWDLRNDQIVSLPVKQLWWINELHVSMKDCNLSTTKQNKAQHQACCMGYNIYAAL